MPSKLKKAIEAVKDQTSISLARVKTTTTSVSSNSHLEVSILKATTHDELPVDDRHVADILAAVSSNRSNAAVCARALGRRIGRTRSWVVAVKSLLLVLRLFQDGDPHFPKEVLQAMKRGYKILNLSSFRSSSATSSSDSSSNSSSSSSPWDFTAFVRTFSLYLDDRLHLFLTGKLQRRRLFLLTKSSTSSSSIRDMKPPILLDRISCWQRLLDRAIATRPTGAAKSNRLVQSCLYAIVQETFDLHRDISDGLALLLDGFFHLEHPCSVAAFHTCAKASRQFDDLCSFYDLCKSSTLAIGRSSEYPSVQRISDEVMRTLHDFLKDQSSLLPRVPQPPNSSNLLRITSTSRSTSGAGSTDSSEANSWIISDHRAAGSRRRTSLEDLIMSADAAAASAVGGRGSATVTCASPDTSYNDDDQMQERYSDPGTEKPSQLDLEEDDDLLLMNVDEPSSLMSDPPITNTPVHVDDLLLLSLDHDDQTTTTTTRESDVDKLHHHHVHEEQPTSTQGWELALLETATSHLTISNTTNINNNNIVINASLSSPHHYNPFLEDPVAQSSTITTTAEPINTNIAGINNLSPATIPTTTIDHLFAPLADNNLVPCTAAPQTATPFSNGFPLEHLPNGSTIPAADDSFTNDSNGISYVSNNAGARVDHLFPDSVMETDKGVIDMFAEFGNTNAVQATDLSNLNNNNNNNVNINGISSVISSSSFHHSQFNNIGNEAQASTSGFGTPNGHVPPSFKADFGVDNITVPPSADIITTGTGFRDHNFSLAAPTFKATTSSTFQTSSPGQTHIHENQSMSMDDPSLWFPDQQGGNGIIVHEQNIQEQQQLWLQNQSRILAKQTQG